MSCESFQNLLDMVGAGKSCWYCWNGKIQASIRTKCITC